MKVFSTTILLMFFALLDELLGLWGVIDFTYQSFFGWVPYFAFCGLYLITYDWDWKDQLFYGAFIGLLYDILFSSTFPVYFILYPLLIIVISALRMFVRVDRLSRLILGCISVFLLEAIPILVSTTFKILNVTISSWFIHQAIVTVVVNGIFLLILDYFLVSFRNIQLKKVSRK